MRIRVILVFFIIISFVTETKCQWLSLSLSWGCDGRVTYGYITCLSSSKRADQAIGQPLGRRYGVRVLLQLVPPWDPSSWG